MCTPLKVVRLNASVPAFSTSYHSSGRARRSHSQTRVTTSYSCASRQGSSVCGVLTHVVNRLNLGLTIATQSWERRRPRPWYEARQHTLSHLQDSGPCLVVNLGTPLKMLLTLSAGSWKHNKGCWRGVERRRCRCAFPEHLIILVSVSKLTCQTGAGMFFQPINFAREPRTRRVQSVSP